MNKETMHPFLHISVDDVITILQDITTHRSQYHSIFENPDMKVLKKLHDQYGAVFTLNLFQYNGENKETSSFDLSKMTDEFRGDFLEADAWLKFAYHSKFTKTHGLDLPIEMLEKSIREMYQDITRFACHNSIDRIPRLGYFSISAEGLLHLKNAGYIKGCLTADDNRDLNCGLTGQELIIMQSCDAYTDAHGISYFRSEHRYDNLEERELISLLDRLNSDRQNNTCFIMFGHTIDEAKMETICKWAVSHHVPFQYPADSCCPVNSDPF